MEGHGVFISYRRPDWALAGRIYDFLQAKGMYPFMDYTSMAQGRFPEELRREIQQAPYFLCVLTPNTFSSESQKNWVCQEIEVALSSPNTIIRLIATEGFFWPDSLPESIRKITEWHFDVIKGDNFHHKMEQFCERNIDWNVLSGVLDWQQRINSVNNVYLSGREDVDYDLAPLTSRFGAALLEAVEKNLPYEGENPIRFVHMSCYAGSALLTPQQDMMDERAYDRKKMFKVFSWLLKDSDFSMEIIINAPGSFAMQDAIAGEKLGNSALEMYPEAIFLSAYHNLSWLIREDPVFSAAYREKRFRFMVTENVLPYALFQVEYKPEHARFSHIKVDLYSEGITSNMDRRTMMIFKKDNLENYNFFVERYKYTRNPKESQRLIRENHEKWVAQWQKLKEQLT